MNLSILHISDLHRDHNNLIQNNVLLDSLENDCRHFSDEEDPKIRMPDLIVVSGDIIQGIKADTPNPQESLRKQYDQALELLIRLAEGLIGGDRERIIIVPGNHDMSAYHLQKSLERVDIHPNRKKELVNQLFSPESKLRWSWHDLSLYKISDEVMYLQRVAAFACFYSEFYNGKRTYDLDPAKQVDIFDYPQFNLTVVGFSSCHNNDLYNKRASIYSGCIADATTRLRHTKFANRHRMAVWHHNTEASPIHSDFVDPDQIQNLIDRGFSLGLHGHQHRPQYLDIKFRHGIKRSITIISAGTLCGGPSFRHGRSYNVIELNTTERTGRLHVREMQNDNLGMPIWGRRVLQPNTCSFYEFVYDPPLPTAPNPNVATTKLLVRSQELHSNGNFQEAVDVLVPAVQQDPLVRPMLLDCLVKLNDINLLLEIFDPPVSGAEAIHVMDALWESGKRERLSELINSPLIANSSDSSVVEIRDKFRARVK